VPDAPDQKPAVRRTSGALDGLVRAERLMQIAFILPAAVVVGWLAGAGLDKWLHQHWIYLAGIVVGCVAGFVEIFRLVLNNEKEMEKEDRESRS
jgi:F0F1-type ATP synthase assembly protein I